MDNELGSTKTKYEYDNPTSDILKTFENEYPNYLISIKTYEFTSLCPVTGQPDFATIIIQYIPDKQCVESKSLKLYLGAYRNNGMFHEKCVNKIIRDCTTVLDPLYIRVIGDFAPRGGISINPVAEYTKPGYIIGDMMLSTLPILHNTHSHI